MEGACGPGFGLHLYDVGKDAPQIRLACERPRISMFAHRRRRGDGVDGNDFAEFVGYSGSRFVSIDRDEFWIRCDIRGRRP
jgi:hypothetical protein